MATSDLHKAQNERFIQANPTFLVLYRKARIDDGAGGKMSGAEVTLNAQEVRVVTQPRLVPRVTEDGRTVYVERSIVGSLDLDIEIGDEFVRDGKRFQVINVQAEPGWSRTLAEAVHHG